MMAAVTTMASGVTVAVTHWLPIAPTPGEEARRIVRHGFAKDYTDFETWDGPVGYAPDEPVHTLRSSKDPKVVYVSRKIMVEMIKRTMERGLPSIPIIREPKEPVSE